MRIIVDAMGGDNAPQAIVKGALQAQKELGAEIVLVGRKEAIEGCLEAEKATVAQIVDAREIITMDDDPSTATRRKKDSSMAVALKMLHDGEGDAVVSAGSTGALLTGATLTVKRIRGIRRAALAPVLPNGGKGVMLIDCGANVDCKPEYLQVFGVMGDAYMKGVMGMKEPRVGLINIGAESEKGNALVKATYPLMEQAPYRFVGNVEARDITGDVADVLVADGFTGNVVLKFMEGVAGTLMGIIKKEMMGDTRSKIGALLAKPAFRRVKKAMDYTEVGGAPLLGVQGAVVKAHGSSNGHAMACAIGQCIKMIDGHVVDIIAKGVSALNPEA